MSELNLYKLVSVIRGFFGDISQEMLTDEEIRLELNRGYEMTHSYGRIKEITVQRLREKLG